MLLNATDTIPLRSTADGKMIYFGKSRVPLETVIKAFHKGDTPEIIVYQFPSLQLADVYLVIGYYLNHRAEVDEYIEAAETERQRVQEENEKRFPSEGFKEELLVRISRNV